MITLDEKAPSTQVALNESSAAPGAEASLRLLLVALLGATGVLAAAFGAHGLEKVAGPEGIRWWTIAAAMQLVTAPALLFLASNTRASAWAFRLLFVGTLLFCGTLYAMTFGAPRILGAVTPLGGLLMTLGWVGVAVRRR